MLTRFVKMTFRPESVDEFLQLFEGVQDQIRGFEGCLFLELLRDTDDPRVFFTRSNWESPVAFDKYRRSELFATTWKATRAFFDTKAEAWSLVSY